MAPGPLLASRRFLPLFATQFLGAFNDNLFRSAMLFLIAFGMLRSNPSSAALAAGLSGGIFILPYFLFSSLSGELADRIDKARIARLVKLAEVAIMLVGAAALLFPSLPLLYAMLFAMGTHSTVFGPVKYAILPQHLAQHELVRGTGMVEAATFLAILLGQIAGGLLSTPIAAAAMVCSALLGVMTSRFIPPAPGSNDPPAIDRNIGRGTSRILVQACSDRILLHAIIGISWFFALGAILTQQFVPLVARLNARATVATGFLALFSVGIAIGSLLAGRLLGRRVSSRPIAPAALVVAVLTGDLALATHAMHPTAGEAAGIAGFLALPGAIRLCLDLIALAIAGGVYIVPLYLLLQTAGAATSRARDVAANNVVNALAMVLLTIIALVLLEFGIGTPGLFAALAAIGLLAFASALRLNHAPRVSQNSVT